MCSVPGLACMVSGAWVRCVFECLGVYVCLCELNFSRGDAAHSVTGCVSNSLMVPGPSVTRTRASLCGSRRVWRQPQQAATHSGARRGAATPEWCPGRAGVIKMQRTRRRAYRQWQ